MTDNCECEVCKQKQLLEKEKPDKTYGMQYAYMKINDSNGLILSAEEVPYFYNEEKDLPLLVFDESKKIHKIICYGVFTSKSDRYENLFDLILAKNTSHFLFDLDKNQAIEVKLVDYKKFIEKNNQAKVALILESNYEINFPKNQSELAITLSRYMPELGTNLGDILFSRIEYGLFRLDYGKVIETNSKINWEAQIDEKILFTIEYNRLLTLD